jgi:hypothetical protein
VFGVEKERKKMTRFEEAVKIVAEEYREDCSEMDCTIRDLFKCWQFDNEDMKTEFSSILNEKFSGEFTDECEILNDDGKFVSFRQFVKAVKNYQF